MSYNDRLREASLWVRAHDTEVITVTFRTQDLADALWHAGEDPAQWPRELSGWARDVARKLHWVCDSCLQAAMDYPDWLEYHIGDAMPSDATPSDQPLHCGGRCKACPGCGQQEVS